MLAVKPENVERVKNFLDEPVYEIGRIVKKDGASVLIKWLKKIAVLLPETARIDCGTISSEFVFPITGDA